MTDSPFAPSALTDRWLPPQTKDYLRCMRSGTEAMAKKVNSRVAGSGTRVRLKSR